MLTILFLGFLVGMQHAMEADHVAAVASLATRSRSVTQAARQGAAWGLGHSLTRTATSIRVAVALRKVVEPALRLSDGDEGFARVHLKKGTDNPEVNRMLGSEGDLGGMLGLDKEWAYRAIKANGNYAEIFDKFIGPPGL